jgi:hypothetical protein
VPADGAQARSSKGWQGMRHDQVKDVGDLKAFFGGEHRPQTDEAEEPKTDDDEFEKFYATLGEPEEKGGKEAHGEAEKEPDWSSLDDEDFINKLASTDKVSANIPKAAPKAPGEEGGLEDIDLADDDAGFGEKERDPFFSKAEEGEGHMSWDELQAADPTIAADIERDYPDIKDNPEIFFAKDKDGLVMRSGRGRQFKWEPSSKEWLDMDDGGTPAGEF